MHPESTMPARDVIIYALTDPRDGTFHYIGRTVNLIRRRHEHWRRRERERATPKNVWLDDLASMGLEPGLWVLEIVPWSVWQDTERRWIAYCRDRGMPLTNLSDGGAGARGYQHTPTARAKLSRAQRRRWEGWTAAGRPSASGMRGISWQSGRKQWLARATIAGVRYTVGSFATIEDAVTARIAYIEGVKRGAITPVEPQYSKSGVPGVRYQAGDDVKSPWIACVNVAGETHRIGYFVTAQEAADAVASAQGRLSVAATTGEAEETLRDLKALWRRKTSSGLRGINYQTGYGWQSRWVVRVSIGGKRHFVGHYRTVEEARDARDAYLAAHDPA